MEPKKTPKPQTAYEPKKRQDKNGRLKKEPRKTRKNNAWDQEPVIKELKRFLQLGYTVRKSCIYAGIAYTTVVEWLRKAPELRIKFNSWRASVNIKARVNLAKSVDEGNLNTSLEWLRAREKADWATRTEQVAYDDDDDLATDDDREDDETAAVVEKLKKDGIIA